MGGEVVVEGEEVTKKEVHEETNLFVSFYTFSCMLFFSRSSFFLNLLLLWSRVVLSSSLSLQPKRDAQMRQQGKEMSEEMREEKETGREEDETDSFFSF